MNKIIVVGHPQSGLEKVEALLLACGMAQALPSRREGFTPAQISETLVKAHGGVPVEQLQSAQQLQQIKVAPVWQGMVLDLMLTNLGQPLWGWADTQAVYLLDYWRDQDPQVVFVLVYDTPETIMTRAPLDQAAPPAEELQRRIDAWVAYNAALLHFHLRSPGRSVLVHAGQVQASAKSSLHHISTHIKAPLQLPPGLLPSATADSHAPQAMHADTETVDSLTAQLHAMQGSQFKKARKRLRARLQAMQDQPLAEVITAADEPPHHHSAQGLAHNQPSQPADHVSETPPHTADVLANLLAQQLLQAQPQATQLYEELQAAATLAYGTGANPTSRHMHTLPSDGSLAPYQAWQALVQQRLHLQEQTRRTQAQAAHIQLLQQQVQEATSAAQEKQLHLQAQWLQVQQSLQQHQQLSQQQQQAAEQESQLLLQQLHQVQQELQQHHQEGQKYQQEIARLQKAEALAAEYQQRLAQSGAAQADLEQKLQSAQKQHLAAQEAHKENELLLTQLHQVQEELERYYLNGQKLQQDIEQLRKSEALAAERQKLLEQLKKQLDDKTRAAADLEKKLLEQAATGKAALEKTVATNKQQSQQLEQLKKQLDDKTRAAADLEQKLQSAQMHTAAEDTHKENELLLTQLHQVQEELERYYIENQKLKATQPPQHKKAYYGAAERVKQQLAYRLGTTMIAQSRSVGGWLRMPFALHAEFKRFQQDQVAQSQEELPPMDAYRDAHEAERVKQHLSYRLGARMVANSKSLGGWVAMPWALLGETKAFRKARR